MSMTETRTHAVAKTAYEYVAARRHSPMRKEYSALAHKLPGMILQSGLAQATGFLLAKDKDEHRALLDDLNAVLRAAQATTTEDGPALHDAVIGSGLQEAVNLTRWSLEASGWIKRYAQAVLDAKTSSEQNTDGVLQSHGGSQ